MKHFHWEPRGKRRLHARPHELDAEVCRGWLDRELSALKPAVIVALGTTGARAVLGRRVAVTKERGRVLEARGARVVVTWHPSAILRAGDADGVLFGQLVTDLRAAMLAAGARGDVA